MGLYFYFLSLSPTEDNRELYKHIQEKAQYSAT